MSTFKTQVRRLNDVTQSISSNGNQYDFDDEGLTLMDEDDFITLSQTGCVDVEAVGVVEIEDPEPKKGAKA